VAADKKVDITLTVESVSSEFKGIIDRTNKANPTPQDRAALASAFDQYPDLAGIVGNLARRLRKTKIDKLGESHFFRESVTRTMDRIERELGYERAPMASKLLIEQVLASWADLVDVQGRHSSALSGSHSQKEGEYWDARLTRAQARYLRALETLARVNKLSRVVPVQVNIAAQGGQQINMAGGEE
jgi:hypothetical protein